MTLLPELTEVRAEAKTHKPHKPHNGLTALQTVELDREIRNYVRQMEDGRWTINRAIWGDFRWTYAMLAEHIALDGKLSFPVTGGNVSGWVRRSGGRWSAPRKAKATRPTRGGHTIASIEKRVAMLEQALRNALS